MNMSEIRNFSDTALRGELRREVRMSKHTSWRVGGVADCVYQPADLADLQVFLRSLPSDESVYAVGLGSNLLVRDGGLRGTVILLHGALTELRCIDTSTLYVEAGIAGAKLARFAALHNLAGAAFFAGIPGSMGGMLAMNAGCYGSDTWQHVESVQVLTRSGELLTRTAQDYEIGYRHVVKSETGKVKGKELGSHHLSPFTFHQEEFFVSATLKFSRGEGDIERQIIKAWLSTRIATQPLNLPNAGSVFRNPVGDHAARLIELCGLKGKQIGGAQVSVKHANFIVNTGGASAADIENLISEVRASVAAQTGVELHPEVRIIGEAA
ncbi:MAG: UDP-N-acetylmuramate dehydrogenase [Sideroxydans sp.]|nr:UDP-N-acetylmuramate dehydrogenase [Sideroxydans sp.]